jgi:ATP-dependent DNA helicase DinG
VSHARTASARLFDAFRASLGKERLIPEELQEDAVLAYHKLDSSLEAVQNSLLVLEGRDEALDHVTGRVAEIRDELAIILSREEKGFVHWVENKPRSVWLGASPIDVSRELREGIFFQIPSVVLTSATLSTCGDFSFLRSRLGMDFDVAELQVSSPFDFTNQACLYLPEGFPDPRSAEFVEAASKALRQLIEITGGGALILCTSVSGMRALHKSLVGHVPGELFLQGEAPRSQLLADFAAHPGSVLAATLSFWQGVDLPGDQLRLVVIDKLPFASPGDPLEAARIADLTENGKNAFREYQVPAAALLLKQGFGRLIRTEHDRGIVAILDRRIHAMSYGKIFLRSLPVCPTMTSLDDVAHWYRHP